MCLKWIIYIYFSSILDICYEMKLENNLHISVLFLIYVSYKYEMKVYLRTRFSQVQQARINCVQCPKELHMNRSRKGIYWLSPNWLDHSYDYLLHGREVCNYKYYGSLKRKKLKLFLVTQLFCDILVYLILFPLFSLFVTFFRFIELFLIFLLCDKNERAPREKNGWKHKKLFNIMIYCSYNSMLRMMISKWR